jgi:GDP-4-dehydro-6-deoxy-D-mannose reductase
MRDVRPAMVFHLAGPVVEPKDEEGRGRAMDSAVTMTLGLLDGLASIGGRRRMLVASSCAVYGVPARPDGLVREGDAMSPVSFYGLGKAVQETVALLFGRQRGVDVLVTRGFNYLGPGEGERSVTGAVLAQLASGERNVRVGNTDTARDFLDVRDATAAYRTVMLKGEPFRVYNVGSGAAVRVEEVIRRLVAAWGGSGAVSRDESRVRPADVPRIFADNSRLTALGWRPGHSLDETIRDAVASRRGGER